MYMDKNHTLNPHWAFKLCMTMNELGGNFLREKNIALFFLPNVVSHVLCKVYITALMM